MKQDLAAFFFGFSLALLAVDTEWIMLGLLIVVSIALYLTGKDMEKW